MKRSEVDRSKISPMMGQYLDIKDKYEDTIIFFRLGDFYEMFFYVKDGQAIGIGSGQQSRIHCTRLAGSKADE